VTIREAARALREGRVTSTELTQSALERIGRLNPELNAFLRVLPERAAERAVQADRELASGADRGPLHGIPIALKDLFAIRGVRLTAGSIIHDQVPAADAAVVEKLEAAGAVILGTLNLHELAYGVTSENPHFGAVRNPWNRNHSAGGSSGGSGAAVAAGMVFAALGTDTGGSIRIPAAFCGTVGFKPTYGLVSRFGTRPLGFSLDHVGPLARTVRDAAALLNAIASYDSRDPASIHSPTSEHVPEAGCSIRGIRLGVPETFFFERLDGEVESAVRGSIARAASLGAAVRSVQLPDMEAVNTLGQVLLLAEAAAVYEEHLERRDSFGPDVLALLDQGRLLPATDYINAQRLRRKAQIEFGSVWSEVDCLITPTSPIPAPQLGQKTVPVGGDDQEVRAAATRFTRCFNVLGLPAISMPCALTGAGLPVGLQIVAPPFQDRLVLRVAAALEDAGVTIPPLAQ
jgi:aspartyl-tRNA(Asn)/glutamyl-tRNA(Gln) amidotransferase subunit A